MNISRYTDRHSTDDRDCDRAHSGTAGQPGWAPHPGHEGIWAPVAESSRGTMRSSWHDDAPPGPFRVGLPRLTKFHPLSSGSESYRPQHASNQESQLLVRPERQGDLFKFYAAAARAESVAMKPTARTRCGRSVSTTVLVAK